MKKTFVTVTLFVAMAIAANAASLQQDNTVNATTAVRNGQNNPFEQRDIYREHALQAEENDKHIIRFYDIDHIVIKNDPHAVIRIYDDKWHLIEQTNGDVDKDVKAGNYYVTSTSHIKSTYKK